MTAYKHNKPAMKDSVNQVFHIVAESGFFDNMTASKLFTGAAVGMVLGTFVTFVNVGIESLNVKNDATLEGMEIENMIKYNPSMVNTFRTLGGSYYKLCPEKNRTKYKKRIINASKHAECVVIIQRKTLMEGATLNDYYEANKHAKLCMLALRSTIPYFNSYAVQNLSETFDFICVFLSEHLNNIHNTTI